MQTSFSYKGQAILNHCTYLMQIERMIEQGPPVYLHIMEGACSTHRPATAHRFSLITAVTSKIITCYQELRISLSLELNTFTGIKTIVTAGLG